ncbi:MAG: RNA polymerase sigma factor [Candidatus Paceibacterota bacterium]
MFLNKDDIAVLWDTITPKLYGYLVHVLHDKNLAEDVLQTTWLKAIEALPNFKERAGASFSSWLFAIARNECKQHWRKVGREVSFDPTIHDKEIFNSKTEDLIFVDQIMKHLSSKDRELVRLRYIADLPLNEIAKILKVSPITIRVRMHRTLAFIKIILKNQQ